ncbi:MAG: response regulator [Pseudomonadota bacterium]
MNAENTDILLVEDDRRLAELTSRYFEQNGFSTCIEPRGDQAVARYCEVHPRIVLLDIMLPGKNGLRVCRELRRHYDGPILIFTAKDTDIDQVIGLEAGADDYVTKPADPMVLLARTRALLRRAEAGKGHDDAPPEDIVLGELRVSEAAQEVWLEGEPIAFTTQEFDLLLVLAKAAGRTLSRDELYRRTRGIDYDGLDRAIDGRISRIRKKLGDTADAPRRIKTVWGKGYLLAPDAWG